MIFGSTPQVDAVDARTWLDSGAAIAVDVREIAEWQAGRIAGALHIPMGDLEGRVRELPHEQRLIIVCRSGARSHMVTRALANVGYDAFNLSGGMDAWVRTGGPIEPADGFVA